MSKSCCFCQESFEEIEKLKNHYVNLHGVSPKNSIFVKYLESLNSSCIDYKTSKCPFYNKRLFTERARGIHLLILHYQESLREKKRFTYKRN